MPEVNVPGEASPCAFYYDRAIIDTFKNYLEMLLNHRMSDTDVALKDDPVVMAWETGNELVGAPTAWTKEISDFIKEEIGAKQLIIDGRSGIREGVDPGIATLTNVDILDWHYYGMYPLNSTRVGEDAALAKAADKALMIGEYAWTMNGENDLINFLAAVEENTDVAGDLYWSLFPHNDYYGFVYHYDGFTLHYPGDNLDMRNRVNML